MKHLHTWHDLWPFGIHPIAGQSCRFGLRLSCDVTEKGKAILEKCLDVVYIDLTEEWDSGTKDDPHVGSIEIPIDMYSTLAVFCLFESGCRYAYVLKGGSAVGVEANDTHDELEKWAKANESNIRWRISNDDLAIELPEE